MGLATVRYIEVQNKMARFLNSKTLKDKIPTKVLIDQVNMLSVSQINAKIKLQEIWKALNIKNYPLKIPSQRASYEIINSRAMTGGRPIEVGSSCLPSKSCVRGML